MSADLKIMTESAVPPMAPRDFIGRYSSWYNVLWMVIFLLITLGCLGAALVGSFGEYLPEYSADMPVPEKWLGMLRNELGDMGGVRFVFYFLALFFYGFYRLAKGMVTSAGKSSNWLLRAGADGLYVKYRSYLNHAFDPDTPSVLFIPHRLVDSLRGHVRHSWTLRSDSDSNRTIEQGRKQPFIEIFLRNGAEHDVIADALLAERNIKGAGDGVVKSKSMHYPVRLMPDGILRLDWTGLRPRLGAALKALDFWFTLQPMHESREEGRSEMSKKAMEDKLLDLVMEGDTMAAHRLLKDLYGYNTTEARLFIDDLLEKGEPASLEGAPKTPA